MTNYVISSSCYFHHLEGPEFKSHRPRALLYKQSDAHLVTAELQLLEYLRRDLPCLRTSQRVNGQNLRRKNIDERRECGTQLARKTNEKNRRYHRPLCPNLSCMQKHAGLSCLGFYKTKQKNKHFFDRVDYSYHTKESGAWPLTQRSSKVGQD